MRLRWIVALACACEKTSEPPPTDPEGTLRDPRFSYKVGEPGAMKKLTADLHDITNRRWGGKARPPHSLSIVIQADAATPLQTVAEVFGAVRKDAEGRELFPDIQLSSGFE